jgi:hypothetical protein
MRALRISADGWWQTIDIEPTPPNRTRFATLDLRHNIELWYSADDCHSMTASTPLSKTPPAPN